MDIPSLSSKAQIKKVSYICPIMERKKEIRDITLWGAVVNLLLTAGKLFAGIFGRSGAMVADGIHSLSDLLSDAVVLVFTHISSKGKDRDHSFGHGKFEPLATLIVSIILFTVGIGLLRSGVNDIADVLTGSEIPVPGSIALIAAAVSIAAKEILYHATVRVGKRVESTVVIANAWHHRSDALSSIGALDVRNLIILLESMGALRMAIPSLAELLETSLPEEIEQEIIATASAVKGVNDVHELKTRRNGVSFIIDAHIVVNPDISIVEAHDIATDVEEALRLRYGYQTQMSIHVEPDTEAK